MQISIERLKSTLLELSSIGFNEADKGIYRTSFSESDMAARRWLLQTPGVIDDVSGVYKRIVRLIGKADHAGTAPMNMRNDAFMGARRFRARDPAHHRRGRHRPQPPHR